MVQLRAHQPDEPPVRIVPGRAVAGFVAGRGERAANERRMSWRLSGTRPAGYFACLTSLARKSRRAEGASSVLSFRFTRFPVTSIQ